MCFLENITVTFLRINLFNLQRIDGYSCPKIVWSGHSEGDVISLPYDRYGDFILSKIYPAFFVEKR